MLCLPNLRGHIHRFLPHESDLGGPSVAAVAVVVDAAAAAAATFSFKILMKVL